VSFFMRRMASARESKIRLIISYRDIEFAVSRPGWKLSSEIDTQKTARRGESPR
jgi:hypothetical protein